MLHSNSQGRGYLSMFASLDKIQLVILETSKLSVIVNVCCSIESSVSVSFP